MRLSTVIFLRTFYNFSQFLLYLGLLSIDQHHHFTSISTSKLPLPIGKSRISKMFKLRTPLSSFAFSTEVPQARARAPCRRCAQIVDIKDLSFDFCPSVTPVETSPVTVLTHSRNSTRSEIDTNLHFEVSLNGCEGHPRANAC